MRFYLDEEQSPEVAALGQRYGLDVTCSRDCGRNGTTDDVQLTYAASESRAIVTRNADDFISLTDLFLRQNRPHAGVLCLPPSLPNDDFEGIARAIQAFNSNYPDGMPAYMVVWLRRVID
jgi:predicted nuclease of predicted toxin-antitoxin system